jgi:hypothetical protein
MEIQRSLTMYSFFNLHSNCDERQYNPETTIHSHDEVVLTIHDHISIFDCIADTKRWSFHDEK